MKKGVNIEGSRERALDRGSIGFFDLPDGEGPLLTNPVVVESQVRDFFTEVLDVRRRYNDGAVQGADASKVIEALAKRYAAVFMGRDPKNFSFMRWNSEEQLGAFLSQVLNGVPAEQAAEAFFLKLAAEFIVHAVVPFENDQIGEEPVRFLMEAAIEDATFALLGRDNPIE